jgi:hypothetical protein
LVKIVANASLNFFLITLFFIFFFFYLYVI